MCGLAGCLGLKIDKNTINSCINILKSRGPNSSGYINNSKITLVHTRLSILDLSNEGSQPMTDKRTGVTIIYNGEVYNFLELQDLLNIENKISNDTKVLIKLYLKFGIDFVDKISGMFAFAIWDPRINSLYLVRDRFGIKPLYVHKNNNKVIFGSEIKALNILGAERKVNYQTVKNYLNNGILEDNASSFFEKIDPVKPGTIEKFTNNNCEVITYWNIKNNFSNNLYKSISEEETNQYVSEILNKTIKQHLISDVKVGITLSSGVDSQILLKYISQNINSDINAFTYGYDEKEYDESSSINLNYENLKINHYISKINHTSMLPLLEESINYFDSPLGGLGTLSLYDLMKTVKNNDTPVVLSGEGADEVFAGYKYYFYAYLKFLLKNNQNNKIIHEINYWKELTGEDLSNKIDNKDYLDKKIFGSKAPDGTILENADLEGDFLKDFKNNDKNIFLDYKTDELRKIMLNDLFLKKIPKLLMFQDRCSMSSSIESRVPFLDHNLVENIYKLKPEFLIKNGILKYLLRQNLQKNYTPKNIKKYVATPQREWLKGSLYKEIIDIIKNGIVTKNKIIHFNNFEKQYKDYCNSKNLGNSFFIWKILNLEFFMKNISN
tara:strand:- start:297 stop:2126 length:1830 start_codon:yes stop_codon:yes gene_type:complete